MSSLQSFSQDGKLRQHLIAWMCVLSSTLLLLCVLHFPTFQSSHHHDENYFSISCEKLSKISTTQPSPPYDTFIFKQRLDHFDFSNDQTFSQRYFVCSEFVKKHARNLRGEVAVTNQNDLNHETATAPPVFIYTGNEGALESFYENTGLIFEMASKFGALVIFIEHRYYGESLPFGKVNSFVGANRRWLTVEQALADFAYFITEKFGLDENRKQPIITFGGSYGGDLSAWIRMKFPHLVDGAIASSAPIFLFNSLTPPYLAAQVATQVFHNFTDYKVYPQMTCDTAIKKGFSFIQQIMNNPNPSNSDLRMLNSELGICDQMVQNAKDVIILANYIALAFEVLPQANYPYPTNFFTNLPAWPVQVVCERIANLLSKNLPERPEKYLHVLKTGVDVFFNTSGTMKCYNITQRNVGLEWQGWSYQTCNELIMPLGYYPETDMFFSEPYSLDAQIKACQQSMNVTPRPYWATTYFGGKRVLKDATNIVFSNGEYDVVKVGGVLPDMKANPKITIVYIEKAGHHLDLRWSNPADPESVKIARQIETQQVAKYINEFYEKLN